MKLSTREKMALVLLKTEATVVRQRLRMVCQQIQNYRLYLQALPDEEVLWLAQQQSQHFRPRLSLVPPESSASFARLLLELQKQEELALETARMHYRKLRDLVERLNKPL